ncbi:MAG TPA: hypothetical protein VFH27_11245 [Longimicrobiaceae bacterium]|nr:hypothetical protein [Longimicrobiaceae bacterium]
MNLGDLKRERRGDPERAAGVFYALLSCAALAGVPMALGSAPRGFEIGMAAACAAFALGLGIVAIRSFQGRAVSLARGLPAVLILGTPATLQVLWDMDAWRAGERLVNWEGTWHIAPIFVLLVLVSKPLARRGRRNGGRTV